MVSVMGWDKVVGSISAVVVVLVHLLSSSITIEGNRSEHSLTPTDLPNTAAATPKLALTTGRFHIHLHNPLACPCSDVFILETTPRTLRGCVNYSIHRPPNSIRKGTVKWSKALRYVVVVLLLLLLLPLLLLFVTIPPRTPLNSPLAVLGLWLSEKQTGIMNGHSSFRFLRPSTR